MNNEVLNNGTQFIDENGNPVETQYVDEFGNPIDPSLIDENGNYIGETVTQYVDEFGNPIDPSLIDENGNYIGNAEQVVDESGNPVQPIVDENSLAESLNSVDGEEEAVESAASHQMDDKELFAGMVTFDYNNVPITDIVNSIILDAINKGASDIHFDPFDDGIKIRIRIDGELNDYSIVPLYVKKNMITRIKIISGMNITESRVPQDGAIRTELQNKTIDLRVSCLPTNMGEKIVIRIMDYSMSAQGIEALDFETGNLDKVKKMLGLPNGIILVTGATGSGKSTTVYSMLQRLNIEGTNLITVEDPIEMNIGGVNQVQAQSEIGLDFATVLRSILRQDPDVIMIGEIRDNETARIAVRASITGHLVLSTIHTNNSLSTIERLTDMEVERYLLGSSLSGIISQKLARRLCPKCKKLRPTNEYEKNTFEKALGVEINEIYEPVGCPECSRGYRGRIAIHEVLYITQAIRDAITKGVNKEALRSAVYGGENPTKTMLQDGLQKVVDGKTSFEEILKLIDLDDDLGTNTQLGLNDQLDASLMQNIAPVGVAQNITSTQPININITPDMLQGLNLNNLAAADNDDDEEIIVKPVKSKKKKKKVVEVDLDEIENDDIELIDKEEIIEPVQEEEKDSKVIEDANGLREILLQKSNETNNTVEVNLDEIDLSNNSDIITMILNKFNPNETNSKELNKNIASIIDELVPLYEVSNKDGKVLINDGLLNIRSVNKINKDNIKRINNLIKIDDNIFEELAGIETDDTENFDDIVNDINSFKEIDLWENEKRIANNVDAIRMAAIKRQQEINEEKVQKEYEEMLKEAENAKEFVLKDEEIKAIPLDVNLDEIDLDEIIKDIDTIEGIDTLDDDLEEIEALNLDDEDDEDGNIELDNIEELLKTDIQPEFDEVDANEIENAINKIEVTQNDNFSTPIENDELKTIIEDTQNIENFEDLEDLNELNVLDELKDIDDIKIDNLLDSETDDLMFKDLEEELSKLDLEENNEDDLNNLDLEPNNDLENELNLLMENFDIEDDDEN